MKEIVLFQNVSKNDEGEFICISKNNQDRMQKENMLIVRGKYLTNFRGILSVNVQLQNVCKIPQIFFIHYRSCVF